MFRRPRFDRFASDLLLILLLALALPGIALSADAATADQATAAAQKKEDTTDAKKDASKEDPTAAKKDDKKEGQAEPKKGDKADDKQPAKPEEKKPDDKKQAPSDPAKDDHDFALQGEFAGPVTIAPSKYEHASLQIRPLGGGNFAAIQYQGGLPGEPTHKAKAVALVGKRSENFLVLSGGPWAVFVERDHCLVVDREGQKVGRLERVERHSPTLGAAPPTDAVVLFDGRGVDQFINGKMTEDGLLMEGPDVKPMFQDFNLHLEFLLPYMPSARDQGRANSGVYLQSRYEVQVLDSFGEEPVFNGCGALYRFRKADLNMCLPPLEWQTYDIVFTAPRWGADGKKIKNALITVWQNGVKIHNNVELDGPTGAGKPEEPNLLPIKLQNHGNPVRFRNIWIVDRGAAPAGKFPVLAKVDAPAGDAVKGKADKPAEKDAETSP